MGLPASLAGYFINEGLNKSGGLATCMESISEKVRAMIYYLFCDPNNKFVMSGYARLCDWEVDA